MTASMAQELGELVYAAVKIGHRFEEARKHGDWSEFVKSAGVGEVFAQAMVECFREYLKLKSKGLARKAATDQLVLNGWANKLAPHFAQWAEVMNSGGGQ